MKTLRISLLFLLSVIIHLTTDAHVGGHYQPGDGTVFNTWRLTNGQQIKGNFYAYHYDKVILERENGKLITLSYSQLSEQDQKLLKRKIKDIEQRNFISPSTAPESRTSFVFNPLPLLLLLLGIWLGQQIIKKNNYQLQLQSAYTRSIIFFMLVIVSVFSCKKTTDNSAGNNNSGTVIITIPKTSIGFIDSVFEPFKPAITTSYDNTYYYINSTGIPQHNMMIGITNWQQQVPIPQSYSGSNYWSIPLQPVIANTPLSTKTNLMKGAVAVAINGIPIFNALNNRGEDSYQIGELDNWGGHCGKADDYHYHAAPLHLSSVANNFPIAYALDGFPVYGAKEPDGTAMASLDTCHGHTWNSNNYHYHGTNTYPYVVGAMKGKVTLDPSTPAPENQILPQAFAKAARPSTSPLNGASITNFSSTGTNAYLLTYKIGIKNGYVAYSWNTSNLFSYTLTDTAGKIVTNTYQR